MDTLEKKPGVVSPTPATESEIHYKELQSYFKWLIGVTFTALGVIIAFGLFFFFRDISQIRLDAANEIKQARESVNSELSKIRQDAASIARAEAQKGVDDAFKTTNIVSMVESAAKRQVGPVIERHVRSEVDRVMEPFQTDMASLSQVADYASQMRIGLRSGLTHLSEIQRKAPSETIRMRAKSLIENIGTDYETSIREQMREFNMQRVPQAYELYLRKESVSVQDLVEVIESDRNLQKVAFAFIALRETTGFPFEMFDIEGVKRWCGEHKKECGK